MSRLPSWSGQHAQCQGEREAQRLERDCWTRKLTQGRPLVQCNWVGSVVRSSEWFFLFRCGLTGRANPHLLFSRGPLSDIIGYAFASSKMPIQGQTSEFLSRGSHEYQDLCDIVLLTLV